MNLKPNGNNLFFLLLVLAAGSVSAGELEVAGGGAADFGSYSAAEDRSHTFRLTNRGDSPVTLKAVRSTCACLAGEVNNRKLLPGECFELPVTIRAGSVTGKFVKVLYLETDRPDRRFLRLELRGEARPLIAVTPDSMLYAGRLAAGKRREFRFELIPDSPGISISVNGKDDCTLEKKKGGWVLTCGVTPGADESVWERTFQIDIASPAGAPPVRILIRGTVEREQK